MDEVLISAKNKVNDRYAWVWLFKLVFGSAPDQILRIAANTDDIIWNGDTWTAWSIKLGTIRLTSKKDRPSVVLQVSNVNRAVQYQIEQTHGANDAEVDVFCVYTGDLSRTNVPSYSFDVLHVSDSNPLWATFELGAQSPVGRPDPPDRMYRDFCRYEFPGGIDERCPYTGGTYTTCNHTRAHCAQRNATKKYFGGFPGIRTDAIYVG